MRVDGVEVEISSDQEDDSLDGGDLSETASATLGGLEQAVEGFQKSIGLARLRPCDDALQVRADHPGHLLHRIDLGTHDTAAPVLQHGAHDIDLFAIQNLTQLLLVDPGPSGALDSHLGDQGVQISSGLGFELGRVLEQSPAHALEGLVGALLDPAHLVHCRAGMADNVELVKGDARVGQMLGDPSDEGRRHVDAGRGDVLGRATMVIQVLSQLFDGLGVAPLCDEQHAPEIGVSGQGDVAVASPSDACSGDKFVLRLPK